MHPEAAQQPGSMAKMCRNGLGPLHFLGKRVVDDSVLREGWQSETHLFPKTRRHVKCRSSAAPSRKLVERFSSPFSSSPEPSLLTAHPPSQVRPASSSRCSRGELPPRDRLFEFLKTAARQLSRIDADAKLFSPRAAAFPPSPGPVPPSRRRLVAPFARPASGPRPSAGSPALPVLVMARSTRSLVSKLRRAGASRRTPTGKIVPQANRAIPTGAVVDG